MATDDPAPPQDRIASLEARLAELERAAASREPALHLLAVDAAGAGLWELDLETQALIWSGHTRALLGVAPDTPPDVELAAARIHPADRAALVTLLERAARPDDPTDHYRTEFRFVHEDGRTVWVDARGRVDFVEAPHGAGARLPVRMLGVMVDITERKKVEQDLRESQRRLATLLSNLPGMAYRCLNDPDWTMLFVSEGCRALSGYDAARLTSGEVSFNALIHAEDRAGVWDQVQAALACHAPFKLEYRIRHADGSERWVWEQGQGVYDEHSGELVALEGFITDVTARRRAEDALRDADRHKDEFLAMLGHELRNPLGIIRAASQVLALSSRDDHDHAGDAAMLAQTQAVLERQTAHMARLVDGLLDVSRIVRGKLHLEREPLELTSLVAQVVADHAGLLRDATRVCVELVVRDAPLWVEGDRVRLVQVVDNLLANALKATPGECGRITLTVEREGADAVVRVHDTGIGIAPEMLDFIFEPFQQAPQPLARPVGGLGLGLALVRGIVELHGGSVVARSEGASQGAEFVVRLATREPPSAPVASAEPAPLARHWRILLVEDNADAAQLLRRMLLAAGHEVHLERDGHDVVAAALAQQAEVILCDLGLPGPSGYQVARAVRAEPALRDTLLVAVTGYGHDEARQQSREAGFDAHLNKPVDLPTLETTLARLAEQQRRAPD